MSFERIQGQEPALRRLKALIAARRLPPALLFYGPAGVGKTLAALEFAKALNCESPSRPSGACDRCPSCAAADKGIDLDLRRVNSAYQAGLLGEEAAGQQHLRIETVRHLVKDLEMRSLAGRWKTAVIEDAERLVPAAANALLKALEEPPPRTLWILVASRREEMLPTVLSRCQSSRFRPLAHRAVVAILAGHGVGSRDAALLARLAEGSPGRALELHRRELPDPASWLADPLAPFRLAESLPRELALARPAAEDHILRMAWHLRLTEGPGGLARAGVRRALAALESLRRAVRANADPRLALELAAMELQTAERKSE